MYIKNSNKVIKGVQIFVRLLPIALSSQVVDNGGRGDSLACARRTLDQTEGTLQHSLHGIHLYYSETHTYKHCGYKT